MAAVPGRSGAGAVPGGWNARIRPGLDIAAMMVRKMYEESTAVVFRT
jgi:hypothetical protein